MSMRLVARSVRNFSSVVGLLESVNAMQKLQLYIKEITGPLCFD